MQRFQRQSGRAHPMLRALVVLLFAALLAACAARPGPEALNVSSLAAPGAKVVTIYVATTRAPDASGDGVFGGGRAQQMRFAQYRISIPPGHQPGRIEWPASTPDPATSFATVEREVLDRETFARRVASRQSVRASPNAGVFVHGFNCSFQESLYLLAEVAADADLDVAPILFAWPSEAELTGYVADKDAATISRDALADLLTMLAEKRAGGRITVVGHSMGGWLTMEAARQLRLSGRGSTLARLNVILAAPDIDVDVFRSQMEVVGRLTPPVTALVSPDDVALSISSRLAKEKLRVGALDVVDPKVQAMAKELGVQIVDISTLKASDGFKHDRFVSLAELYPQLNAASADRPGHGLRSAGAFVFNAVGMTLSAPFGMVGKALAGE